MGNGKTFTLADGVVAVYQTDHAWDWYSTFDQGGVQPSERYWANAQLDARDYAGAEFYQWDKTWVIYLDAPTLPGQHAGGASTGLSGICVLTGKDTDALMGEDPQWTVCREIGGCTHEYLHTHNLPHPPPGPDFGRAVMGTGYGIYPDCVLLDADKQRLDVNPFFDERAKLPAPHNLCPFDGRVVRPPRPRPTPRPWRN